MLTGSGLDLTDFAPDIALVEIDEARVVLRRYIIGLARGSFRLTRTGHGDCVSAVGMAIELLEPRTEVGDKRNIYCMS